MKLYLRLFSTDMSSLGREIDPQVLPDRHMIFCRMPHKADLDLLDFSIASQLELSFTERQSRPVDQFERLNRKNGIFSKKASFLFRAFFWPVYLSSRHQIEYPPNSLLLGCYGVCRPVCPSLLHDLFFLVFPKPDQRIRVREIGPALAEAEQPKGLFASCMQS